MTYRTGKPTFVSPVADTGATLEKTERQVDESWAGFLEVIWIASGVAGWAVAGGIGYATFWEYAPLPWFGVTLGIAGMLFFLAAGLYVVLKFGLDEWQNPARIYMLEGMVAERDATIDAKERIIEQLMHELEEQRRPIVVTRAWEQKPAEPRVVQHVRKLVERKRLGMSTSRDDVVGKFHVMTQTEWHKAMALLAAAGMTYKGGVGNQQTLIKDLPPETVIEAAKAKYMEFGAQIVTGSPLNGAAAHDDDEE